MRAHWSTLADALEEIKDVTLGDTQGDAKAVVETRADTLAEVESVTLSDTRSDAQTLLDSA